MHRIKRDVPGALLVALVITVLPGLPRSAAAGGTRTLAPRLAAVWHAAPGLSQARLVGSRITEFALPISRNGLISIPIGITRGPDGNLWFTESAGGLEGAVENIGRITPRGSISEFALPTTGADPLGITAGPDGAVWFTEYGVDRIGRLVIGPAVAPAAQVAYPPAYVQMLKAAAVATSFKEVTDLTSTGQLIRLQTGGSPTLATHEELVLVRHGTTTSLYRTVEQTSPRTGAPRPRGCVPAPLRRVARSRLSPRLGSR